VPIRPLPDIRPDIWYPAFGLAGYPAKSVSGASLTIKQRNLQLTPLYPKSMLIHLKENVNKSSVSQKELIVKYCFFPVWSTLIFSNKVFFSSSTVI
jgi:hypothetical protein